MMRFMQVLAGLVGALLLAGEVARRGDSVLAQPKAWDDLLAGAVLLGLALAGARATPALHAAGWGLFSGVMLATLGVNLDAWIADAQKPRAGLYSGALALMLGIGAAAALWWARRR
ncbi:hypothetical protein FJQ54_05885 [Sandaracinobacter neustonicus]|uniref:Uncharacterized protein n=1 Tax=Sandaracinobacter neustonicus TaxID=1715348 RepID=A0A501XPU4_9SPHN|nr:hypothetical protein [Sandaracinobacter neustonicus]TPE62429.1 hypothetical protein FJQ54_05885 [Sandaracinobacter neustonicus]